MPSRIVTPALVAAVVLALIGYYGVATACWVIGSVEGGWIYKYVRPWTLRPVLVALLTSAAAAALLRIDVSGSRERSLLFAWLLLAPLGRWPCRPAHRPGNRSCTSVRRRTRSTA